MRQERNIKPKIFKGIETLWKIVLFAVGFYMAVYGIANQQYANSVNTFQTKVDRNYSINSEFNTNHSIKNLINLQNYRMPPEPSFFSPVKTLKCFLEVRNNNHSVDQISELILKPVERLINEGSITNINLDNMILNESEEVLVTNTDVNGISLVNASIQDIKFIKADLDLNCDNTYFTNLRSVRSTMLINGFLDSDSIEVDNSLLHIEDSVDAELLNISWSLLNTKSSSASSLVSNKLKTSCSLIANLNIISDTIQGQHGCTTYFYNCSFPKDTYFEYLYGGQYSFNHGEEAYVFYNCKIGSDTISTISITDLYDYIDIFGFKDFAFIEGFLLDNDDLFDLETFLLSLDRSVFVLQNIPYDSAEHATIENLFPPTDTVKYEF